MLEQRAKALQRCKILDTAAEESFDAITRLASAICGTPFSAVSFLDAERQWFKSTVGLTESETSISESFCRYTVRQDEPLVVCDASSDPRFKMNSLVIGGPKLRFYAGCAIRAQDGTPVGAICVLDTEARPRGLTKVEKSTLEVLARQVEAQMELRLAMTEREKQLAASRDLAERLAIQGSHDTLTALPNRSFFNGKMREVLEICDREGSSMTLILLDIDHFKQTNDALGHDAGDALLCGFSANLKSTVRGADFVARLGGDEFAIMLTNVGPSGPSAAVINQILDRIRQPIKYGDRLLECRASLGVATYPKDAKDTEALRKTSDLALAAAKLERNSAVIFHPGLLDCYEGQVRAVVKVKECLASDGFDPFYQPKIELSSGRRLGFEALMRWRQPAILDLPSIFDPEFPDKPLVAKIGLRMIEKILDDMKLWFASGIDVGKVAINSSAVDFARNDFGENLLAELKRRNIPPRKIELEITECVFLGRGVSHIARALRVLREAGVSIALDDFGTGYASLTHLRQFPIDVLKIDQAFVGGIMSSVDDAAIVRAVIGLAKNLGLITVAEGVETAAQEAFVRHHGCDIGQGFLYGRAVPARTIRSSFDRQTEVA